MRNLKATLLLAASLLMSLAAEAQTKIYGNVMGSDQNATPMGIYSFNAEDGLEFEAVKVDNDMNAINGGVYENGKYHFINMFTYYEYNAETWAQVKKENLGFMVAGPMQATALAYDATTDKVFGCFMDYTTYSYVFGTVDYNTYTRTAIKSLGENIMRCMVCTPEGRVYGINGNGMLYEFNKTTGELTEVGSTGMDIKYVQGAVCDPKDGTVYWAAYLSNDRSGLYELDLETASALLIAEFPHNEEVTGLFILPTADADATPKAVSNLKSNFLEGSLSGTFSFTMPTQSNLDTTLSEGLEYVVTVDKDVVCTGTSQPGAEVVTQEVTLTRGHHDVAVVCKNASGESLATYDFPFIGLDTPKAVTNLAVNRQGKTIHISWDAVCEGLNGGYMGNVTYTVVRYPEAVTLAENTTERTLTDAIESDNFTRVWYSVVAVNNGQEQSQAVTCDPVTYVATILPPYTEQFNTRTSLDGYTVIDVNGDGTQWEINLYNPIAECYSSTGSNDDVLVTPAISLNNDRVYKVTMRLGNNINYGSQSYRVMLLRDNSDYEHPVAVAAEGEIINDTKTLRGMVSVREPGNYHLAVRTTGVGNYCEMQLSLLSIDEGTLYVAPSSSTYMMVTPDYEEGTLNAEVEFITPDHTCSGEDLVDVTKVELYRNDCLIHTFDNPGVGTKLKYQDAEAEHGINEYAVVAYNGDLKGLEAYSAAWVGLDSPAAPLYVKAEETDGGINISWTPSQVGAHGGYVVPGDFRYYVEDNNGYPVAQGITETTFCDNIDTNADQALTAYAVIAYNSVGQSTYATSNVLLVGAPYTLPFQDSFRNAQPAYFWGIDGTASTFYRLYDGASSDLDGGSVLFQSNEKDGKANLYTGKLSLQGNDHATLFFDYYCDSRQQATLDVVAYSPQRGYKTIGTVDMRNWNSYRWLTEEFSLDEFINDTDLQIYFVGTGLGNAEAFLLDRFVINTQVSGIENVTAVDVTPGAVYNIAGQRVNSNAKGLTIQNGRKTLRLK